MEAKLAKYERYRNVLRRLSLFSGIWPHLEDTCRLYRLVTFSTIFLVAFIGTKICGYCIENIANFSFFAKEMGLAFSFYSSVLKAVCYLVYRKDLVMLNDCLGRRYEEELKQVDRRPLLLQSISVYMRFSYVLAVFSAVAIIFYTLLPLMFIFKYKKLVYIYQGKYPFAVEPGGRVYWCLCFVESISGVCIWNIVCSVDNAFGLHSFRMCGLLRSLAGRFAKLQADDPGYIVELRECVRTHQLVLRSKEALQRVYGLIVLCTYVTNGIIMCSVLYQADQAKKHMTVTRVIFFASYMTLKLLQSFTYAYYGSLVSQEVRINVCKHENILSLHTLIICIEAQSEKCQNAIYTSNWSGAENLRLMKDILIIQTQRPIILKANGFFVISMKMFEKIINTTISYFFLLQTVEEK